MSTRLLLLLCAVWIWLLCFLWKEKLIKQDIWNVLTKWTYKIRAVLSTLRYILWCEHVTEVWICVCVDRWTDGWKDRIVERDNQLIWNWLNLYRLAHSLCAVDQSSASQRKIGNLHLLFINVLYKHEQKQQCWRHKMLNKQRQIAINANNSNVCCACAFRSSQKFHYRKLFR